jgi:predicted RNA binding protein YcfA (HicA-like mRNA interferase family)
VGKLPKQTKRGSLIKRFRELRFTGPHRGTGDHPEYMARGDVVVKLPNRHRGDIGEGLLKKILSQAGVSVEEWLGIDSTPEPEAQDGEAAADP